MIISLCSGSLAVVNPQRSLPVDSREVLDQYTALDATLPPHIFGIAALAFKEYFVETSGTLQEPWEEQWGGGLDWVKFIGIIIPRSNNITETKTNTRTSYY